MKYMTMRQPTFYIAFLWAAGPISFSKAWYDTSRLLSAVIPTPTIDKTTSVVMRPMKMAVARLVCWTVCSVRRWSEPGVKN